MLNLPPMVAAPSEQATTGEDELDEETLKLLAELNAVPEKTADPEPPADLSEPITRTGLVNAVPDPEIEDSPAPVAPVETEPEEVPPPLDPDAGAEAPAIPETDPEAPPPSPLLRSGLILNIRVSVLGKPEFSPVQRRITQTGIIQLPLLGPVKVVGMTLDEARVHMQKKYAEFIRNPDVELTFVYDENDSNTSPWGYVTVQGRVNRTGRVNLPQSQTISLTEAIRLAGGFSTSAKTKDIKIRRPRPDGSGTEEISFDLKNAGKEGHARDILLKHGDTVWVPERWF